MNRLLLLAGCLTAGVLALWWMQQLGWVNLKATGGGAVAGGQAWQELMDPPARHVRQVEQNAHRPTDPGGPPRH